MQLEIRPGPAPPRNGETSGKSPTCRSGYESATNASVGTRSGGELRAAGLSLLDAGSAEAAIALLATQPVDLILTDIAMPAVDGLELTRRLKKDARWSDVPVIVLTGLAGKTQCLDALNAELTMLRERAELALRDTTVKLEASRLLMPADERQSEHSGS